VSARQSDGPAGPAAVAAVDLGASSGRVTVGRLDAGSLELHEVRRFRNVPVSSDGALRWDIAGLHAEVVAGLAAAAVGADLLSVGIDSWGVDYGLLGADGTLNGDPVHYRDARTDGALPRLLARVPATELYAVTGIQQLPINTICQLIAAAGTPELAAARTLLLIPDLLGYWLTGEIGAEVTNASTTQLLDARTRRWATGLMRRAGIDPRLFPPLRGPGEVIGELRPGGMDVPGGQADSRRSPEALAGLPGAQAGSRRSPEALAGLPLVAVGSHDTASAVAAVPARDCHFAYISCGTWSLVGMELDAPVLTEASRLANFSNEAGIDGTVRYLRNAAGLWPLQETLRGWAASGPDGPGASGSGNLDDLMAAAAGAPALAAVIDLDDPAFLPPGDMPARIASACRRTGQQPPRDRAGTVRCILDSLALAHRRAVRQAQELTGHHADVVHIVGGGARNELLCQLTADACGLPVVAGPAEATSLGNILVQLRAHGRAPAELTGMRAMLRAGQPLRSYEPSGRRASWAAAERRLG